MVMLFFSKFFRVMNIKKCLFLKTPDLKVDHASWNLICSHRESSFEDLLLVVYLQQRRYTVDKVIPVNYLKLQVEVPWQHWLGKKKTLAVILLPLHVASLTHQNPQRCKIIHGMRPIGRKEFGRISCSCEFYGCCLKMHIYFSLFRALNK